MFPPRPTLSHPFKNVNHGTHANPVPVDESRVTSKLWLDMDMQPGATKRDDLVATANELFDVVAKGIVKIEINQTYLLKDAVSAHRDLEARRTTGSTVLLP